MILPTRWKNRLTWTSCTVWLAIPNQEPGLSVQRTLSSLRPSPPPQPQPRPQPLQLQPPQLQPPRLLRLPLQPQPQLKPRPRQPVVEEPIRINQKINLHQMTCRMILPTRLKNRQPG